MKGSWTRQSPQAKTVRNLKNYSDNSTLNSHPTHLTASEIASLREEAQAFKSVRALLHNSTSASNQPLDSDAAASAVFAKVYDQDIRRLLSMSDMWRYRVPPVPLDRGLILKGEFVDPRKESIGGGGSEVNGSGNTAESGSGSGTGSGLKDQKALSLKDNVELLDDRYVELISDMVFADIVCWQSAPSCEACTYRSDHCV
jgi:hypothetical protein